MNRSPMILVRFVTYFRQTLLVCLSQLSSGMANSEIQSRWQDSIDPSTAARWADDLFGPASAAGALDAASVAIVKDGEILLQKGYGYADVIAQRPATGTTPFRSGSVNKVFTAIAILQLVEQGVLELDDEINRHLSRAKVETPLGVTTVRHLITHSAGFEERFRGTLNAQPKTTRATRAYIEEHAHEQVRKPGFVLNYSNHGMALAGTIIEDVTGLTYGEYIAKHIFAPLNMNTAVVEQPGRIPTDAAQQHSIGDDGQLSPRPLLYKETFYLGSGGFYFSSLDMAKFMNAVLARSSLLLQASSWEQMFTRELSSGEGYSGGIGLGFWMYEMQRYPDGTLKETPSVTGQGGDTEGFSLRMLMLPEERVGIFFATVKSTKSVFDPIDFDTWSSGFDFIEQFRGFPSQPTFTGEGPPLSAFVGSYVTNRRPFAGSEFFLSILSRHPQRVSLRDNELLWSGTALRRIGARSFDYPADGELRPVVSFSDDLQTVWRNQSTSYRRYAAFHPHTYLGLLVIVSAAAALFSLVPALWPRRRVSRRLDVLLAAAALLAVATIAVQPLALLLGDHWRLESPRFLIQAMLGWAVLALTAYVSLAMIRSRADKLARPTKPLVWQRRLALLALGVLVSLFVAYDVLKL